MLTTIKEAVDNSLDACEEGEILPEIIVEIIDMGNERFRVIVEDNGPGIVKSQIPKIFAKLLYGSKFHRMRQSRGQQGIGISASVMYAQLTTGRAAKITSTIGQGKPAHYYELKINTQKNAPEIIKDDIIEWKKDHGTRIELDLEASYQGGQQSVDEYLKETAITNPHVTIIYTNPKAEQLVFPRATENQPHQPKEIKPHPYGVELGMLMQMLKYTEARTLQSFLTSEFTRVGSGTAKQICENAALLPNTKPKTMKRESGEKLFEGIKKTKLINPPTDCSVAETIGANAIVLGLIPMNIPEIYKVAGIIQSDMFGWIISGRTLKTFFPNSAKSYFQGEIDLINFQLSSISRTNQDRLLPVQDPTLSATRNHIQTQLNNWSAIIGSINNNDFYWVPARVDLYRPTHAIAPVQSQADTYQIDLSLLDPSIIPTNNLPVIVRIGDDPVLDRTYSVESFINTVTGRSLINPSLTYILPLSVNYTQYDTPFTFNGTTITVRDLFAGRGSNETPVPSCAV